MSATRRKIGAKSAVFIGDGDSAWLVAETPSEVAALIERDPDGLIELTLGNLSEWNGKPLYLRANRINSISPPRDQDDG